MSVTPMMRANTRARAMCSSFCVPVGATDDRWEAGPPSMDLVHDFSWYGLDARRPLHQLAEEGGKERAEVPLTKGIGSHASIFSRSNEVSQRGGAKRPRPDIRQAEQTVIGTNAGLGVAVANFFPTVGLSTLHSGGSNKIGTRCSSR